jgi:RNA polymerase sigma-70 factor (ECF subfamily)
MHGAPGSGGSQRAAQRQPRHVAHQGQGFAVLLRDTNERGGLSPIPRPPTLPNLKKNEVRPGPPIPPLGQCLGRVRCLGSDTDRPFRLLLGVASGLNHRLLRILVMSTARPKESIDDVMAQLAPLRRYARALIRDETQAEDLVHDALVRAYERRSTFRSGANLRNWLLSILHNTFIDGYRRRQAELRREAEAAGLADLTFPAEQESRLHLQQVSRAFVALPEEQRAVLHLVAIEGLAYQEAANALNIPIGTLMSRLSRARAALRASEENKRSAKPVFPAPADHPPRPTLRVVGGSDD